MTPDPTRAGVARRIRTAAHLTGSFTLRSGRVATEYFDKYRFEADPVLLDDIARLMAPLVPPGTEVLAGLRRAFPRLPVLVMSAHGSATVRAQVMALGATTYMLKPVRRQELLEALEAALADSR